MAVTDQGDAALLKVDETVHAWVEALEQHPDAIDPSVHTQFEKTIREAVKRLNDHLPIYLDADASNRTRKIIIDMIGDLDQLDPTHPLDVIDQLLLRYESMRHIIRDAVDGTAPIDHGSVQELAQWLEDALNGVSDAEVAELVGMSERQIDRWVKGQNLPTKGPSERLLTVIRLTATLRNYMTARGVVMWFHRARTALDGKAPIELLDDPSATDELIVLAKQGRSQHGT